MQFVRGASFDKKEFKRNVVGSVSYAPASTYDSTYIIPALHWGSAETGIAYVAVVHKISLHVECTRDSPNISLI